MPRILGALSPWYTILTLLLGAEPTRGYGAEPPVSHTTAPQVSSPAKIVRYAQRVMKKYDTDGDGRLQQTEWNRMQGHPREIDRNGDGILTEQEFTEHLLRFGLHRKLRLIERPTVDQPPLPPLLHPATQSASISPDTTAKDAPAEDDSNQTRPPASGQAPAETGATDPIPPDTQRPHDTKYFIPAENLPQGLPPWFTERDRDGDGQLTMMEFAAKPAKSDLQQFARYDLNRDGLMTADEYLQATRPAEKKAAKRSPKNISKPADKTVAPPVEEKPKTDEEKGNADEEKSRAEENRGTQTEKTEPQRRRRRPNP